MGLIEAGDKPFPGSRRSQQPGGRSWRQVGAGDADDMSPMPPERWVGNVIADGRWRWDEATGGVAHTPEP